MAVAMSGQPERFFWTAAVEGCQHIAYISARCTPCWSGKGQLELAKHYPVPFPRPVQLGSAPGNYRRDRAAGCIRDTFSCQTSSSVISTQAPAPGRNASGQFRVRQRDRRRGMVRAQPRNQASTQSGRLNEMTTRISRGAMRCPMQTHGRTQLQGAPLKCWSAGCHG